MKTYTVTLRDCVYMEKILEVKAENIMEAIKLAKELEYSPENCGLTWETTHIESLRPIILPKKIEA